MRALAVVCFLFLACGEGVTFIDARRDVGVPGDSGGVDASVTDAAVADAGMLDAAAPDAACEREAPPTPGPWAPVDTGGPGGESLSQCLSRVGALTDDRVPDGQGYELTTFGGPGDEQPVSCTGAADADGTWYYAANAQRFACGARIRLADEERSRCVIVEVADLGPNACVEEAGGQPIWDVSPLAAQQLVGSMSVGWSEHVPVFGAPVDRDNPLGPCDHLEAATQPLAGFIGGACRGPADCTFAGARCLSEVEGYPGGMCTLDCSATCPDRDGPHAFTACADVDGVGRCLARCDYSLFETGCRPGYGCEQRPSPSTGALRSVCLPLACL